MKTLLGADIIVRTLAQEGIRHVFTLPGGQMLPIYYSIAHSDDIDMIFTRHEGASALMAAGYAIATGLPSCVMSTVGAGIAYEIGSLLFSWRERLPVLSISPQVQSFKIKPSQESLQACEQDEIFKPITKFNSIIYHRERIPYLIKRAIKNAIAPEMGPVHLDIPLDIINGFEVFSSSREKKIFSKNHFRYTGKIFPLEQSIQNAAYLLKTAERPLAMTGRNIERAKAGNSLTSFLKKVCIPVISSRESFSSITSDYTGYLGHVELWNNNEGLKILMQSDLLLLFDVDESTAKLATDLKNKNSGIKIIQTAENPSSIESFCQIETGILGSAGIVFDQLSENIQELEHGINMNSNWISQLLESKKYITENCLSKLQQFRQFESILEVIKKIEKYAKPDNVLICEGKLVNEMVLLFLNHKGLHNVYIMPDDYMKGAGLPVAIGAKCAKKSNNVFLLSEADCFKHHVRELQTIKRYNLGVNIFIFPGSTSREVEEVKFTSLSESFGVKAYSISDPAEDLTEDIFNLTSLSHCITHL